MIYKSKIVNIENFKTGLSSDAHASILFSLSKSPIPFFIHMNILNILFMTFDNQFFEILIF